jgi:hypothetical protein
MRQSLSEKPIAALALSIVLAAVAIVDQAGPQSLLEHASAGYAQHGKHVTSGVVYGLVYAAAVVDILLWGAVTALARRRVIGAVTGTVAVLVAATLGVLLLVSSEYGVRPFPPVWGVLALLPPAAGAVWLWVRSTRGRTAASGRPGVVRQQAR